MTRHTRKDPTEDVSFFETYIGIKPRSLVLFTLSIAGAALVSTAIYWGVFGFRHWNQEVTVAGRILTAAVPMKAVQVPASQSGQYSCPVHGAVGLPRFNAAGTPLCPVGGEVMQFQSLNAAALTQAAFAGG